MVDFATTIAPGLSDVLVTGKATEATRRRQPGSPSGFAYDAVVLDAPPTGRIGRFLNVTAEVSGLAKVGPVRAHADSVANVIKSPQTAVHFVSTLEEMPVQETLDGIAEIRSIPGMQVGGDRDQHGAAGHAQPRGAEGAAGPGRHGGGADRGRAAQHRRAGGGAGRRARRARPHIELEDRERTDIEAAGQPVYELTLIPEGIDLAALHRLAAELRDQGAA